MLKIVTKLNLVHTDNPKLILKGFVEYVYFVKGLELYFL